MKIRSSKTVAVGALFALGLVACSTANVHGVAPTDARSPASESNFCLSVIRGDGDSGFWEEARCSAPNPVATIVTKGNISYPADYVFVNQSYIGAKLYVQGESSGQLNKSHCLAARGASTKSTHPATYVIDCGGAKQLEVLQADTGDSIEQITQIMSGRGYSYVNHVIDNGEYFDGAKFQSENGFLLFERN